MAGVRATRFFCAETHGGQIDYLLARDALAGTGADLVWAETYADQLIQANRRELLRLGRRRCRHGRS